MKSLQIVDEKLFEDFCEFAALQLYSTDIDPVYPVLKNSYDEEDLSPDQRVWRTFLYQAVYTIGGAEQLWEMFPEPTYVGKLPAFKTGIERRGLRGETPLLAEHINSVVDIVKKYGGPYQWVSFAAHAGGTTGWTHVRLNSEEIRYNGSWASYKWADLMLNVLELPIVASDIGVGGKGEKAGPIPGMVRLTGWDWKRCAEDIESQKLLLKASQAQGAHFQGLDQLETSLCDFNSLCKGSYYVGNDVDGLMTHLSEGSRFWKARLNVIPHEYLGELNGWYGIRTEMKTRYRDTGVL